ncbi:MAG: DUF2974 domain-containing protein [Clostridia bacterium]|nr:DUF2974 domain-containing protein [Clostridia bacterium]
MPRRITVSPEQLNAAASEIETLAMDYQKNYMRLYSEVVNMQAAWNGADNAAYTARVRGYEDDFQKMYRLMLEYSAFLRMSAKNYKKTQDDIIIAARSLNTGGKASVNSVPDWIKSASLRTISNTKPVLLHNYLSKVSDAEYAKLNDIWTDVSQADDSVGEFFKRLESDLPPDDPLRNISRDQIDVRKSDTGMESISITDGKGNALVIFAGTNGDAGDIGSDALIAAGLMSHQEVEAINLINELSKTNSNIHVSGYSLGGYLATAATLRCPTVTKCVVFDPPGRYDTWIQETFNNKAWSKIKSYEANCSTVSGVGFDVGDTTHIDVEENNIPLINGVVNIHNHEIEKIVDVLDRDEVVKKTWE